MHTPKCREGCANRAVCRDGSDVGRYKVRMAARGAATSGKRASASAGDAIMKLRAVHKVVVPVDFSDESFEALDTAIDWTNGEATIYVVHVLQELSPIEPGELWLNVDPETRRRHALDTLKARLAAPRYERLQLDVVFGDPGHEIAEYAQQREADLIIMPSHGRKGLTRLLIGSVAERVVRLAHCPVLVLRK